jgi:hypothetical protein
MPERQREELTNDFILWLAKRGPHSDFVLDDIVGKTISEHRQIKLPKRYNHKTKNIERPLNPEYDVLIFSDNTFLLTELGRQKEEVYLNYFFYDGQKTSYSFRVIL